jgi:hypothetical protein
MARYFGFRTSLPERDQKKFVIFHFALGVSWIRQAVARPANEKWKLGLSPAGVRPGEAKMPYFLKNLKVVH